jgi:hypothetical protein
MITKEDKVKIEGKLQDIEKVVNKMTKSINESKKNLELAKKNLEENNFKEYNHYMKHCIDEFKFNSSNLYESIKNQYIGDKIFVNVSNDKLNFPLAKRIFEDALPELMKKDRKTFKKVIKLIKEDKNLLSEYQFCLLVEDYNDADGNVQPEKFLEAIKESFEMAIDKKTLEKSNEQLFDLLENANLCGINDISDKDKELYENMSCIMLREQSLSNVNETLKSKSSMVKYLTENKNEKFDPKSPIQVIEQFENKYSQTLNEEEKSFVKTLTESTDDNKKKIFDDLKNECLGIIDSLLSEANTESKEGILDIKAQLLNKEYVSESVIKDVAKLLEIRDVLMEK